MENNILQEKDYIYYLKAISLFSIVSAHCADIPINSNIINEKASWLLEQIGFIGVGVFFIISGYLFNNSDNIINFLLRKIKSIVIPWITLGTLVYLYVVVRKGGYGIFTWFKFIIGDGSYLYYLTLLMLFYFIFYSNISKKYFIRILVFLSITSIIVTSYGYLNYINPYLNPFNFIIYFIIGIRLKDKSNVMEFGSLCYKNIIIILLIYLTGLIYIKHYDITYGYWGKSTLFIQPFGILLIFGLASYRSFHSKKMLLIGKRSFTIYLLHMPIAGIITRILNNIELWQITLIRPLIIIMITNFIIGIYLSIINKLNISYKGKLIIGIR